MGSARKCAGEFRSEVAEPLARRRRSSQALANGRLLEARGDPEQDQA